MGRYLLIPLIILGMLSANAQSKYRITMLDSLKDAETCSVPEIIDKDGKFQITGERDEGIAESYDLFFQAFGIHHFALIEDTIYIISFHPELKKWVATDSHKLTAGQQYFRAMDVDSIPTCYMKSADYYLESNDAYDMYCFEKEVHERVIYAEVVRNKNSLIINTFDSGSLEPQEEDEWYESLAEMEAKRKLPSKAKAAVYDVKKKEFVIPFGKYRTIIKSRKKGAYMVQRQDRNYVELNKKGEELYTVFTSANLFDIRYNDLGFSTENVDVSNVSFQRGDILFRDSNNMFFKKDNSHGYFNIVMPGLDLVNLDNY